ncbi:hypothetical protein ACH5RR_009441 [Cinchona calisaya]|uniref:Glabrous enhancer-binding protein-like DBD domain-containing protein n=1 Tax=Cinchona calisaya TaxID=153742 RepID=A0ABD3AG19_9GENT
MAARPPRPPPGPIPSDTEILNGIHEYLMENRSFPNQDGELGMNVFVHNYLHSNADPQLVRQRMNTLQVVRHMLQRPPQPLWPLLPHERQQKFALCQRLRRQPHISDSHTTSADETSLTGPPLSYNSTSLDESNSIHGLRDVDQSSPLDQTNQATCSRAPHTPTPNPSSEKSYTMTTRGRLFENLNQRGDRDTTAAAQDINILTKMVAYSEANNNIYPYVSAERLSKFVKNWLLSDADPGEIGKRIQKLREMYGKYLILNNNNDEDGNGKPVYSDSTDDRSLLDLSKKLWHDEFGNPNDDSGGGNSSGDQS